jgi:branched-chain amino acid aminotransferase
LFDFIALRFKNLNTNGMVETLNIQVRTAETLRYKTFDFSDIAFGRTCTDHMFIADYKDGQWQDLRIVPYGDIQFEPSLAALHYGQAIFEGMKAYRDVNGGINIFRPYENFVRFNKSAERMCMPQLPEEIFINGLAQAVKLDENWVPGQFGYSLYLRPFMFSTDEFLGVRPSVTYSFMIIMAPAGLYYAEPIRVKVETHFTRAAAGGTGYAKAAGNYAGALYPTALAQKEGYQQLLWTDGQEHAYFEESGTMNVMFVVAGKLLTPATSDTILKGVTRDSVLQLARDFGMEVEERRVSVTEIIEAFKKGTIEEAFGVGTAATIAPIAVIGYEGVDYTLPAEAKFGPRILQALNEIKHGKVADTHGWNYKV